MPDARELVLRVGRIHVHEPELRELERHDAPLGVQVVASQAVQHLQRLLLGEHGGAGVALLLGVAPILAVLRQIERGLALLQLRLLQRHDVGVELAHDVLEPLLLHGPQAVHVPRDEAHGCSLPVLFSRQARLLVGILVDSPILRFLGFAIIALPTRRARSNTSA